MIHFRQVKEVKRSWYSNPRWEQAEDKVREVRKDYAEELEPYPVDTGRHLNSLGQENEIIMLHLYKSLCQ